MKNKNLKKIVVILGPTASGKTDLSIKLAKKFNGEIVSADSRQVYKGMDIGTGKITKKEMKGIPHYLLDVVSPNRKFSVAQYQKLALKNIDKILKKNKIPFLVGGSPFYIYSVLETWTFPKLKPDWRLRKRLEKKSCEELFKILKKIGSKRAENIDNKNKRRLVRAIEIAKKLGKVPLLKKETKFDALILGIKKSKQEIKELIKKRLDKRLKQGEMIKEVRRLRKQGISWKRLESFGLEYKWIALYLQKKIDHLEMVSFLQKDTEHFAKRQMTWFKKDKNTKWFTNYEKAKNLLRDFLE
jgi:tRNA dimethylallyltransferase